MTFVCFRLLLLVGLASIVIGYCSSLALRMSADTLYDMPVSNHGARVRIILYSKNIGDKVSISVPQTIGGLRSPEYLKLNPQGKMPLLVTEDGLPIPESDTISRYIIEKYAENKPTFVPETLAQRMLSEQISRIHDIYITPIQGAMYKAVGTPISTYGTDRKAALAELKRQLLAIDFTVQNFDDKYPDCKGDFLCGKEISLADATLFPTIVFCTFMLPQFFGWQESEFLGPRLLRWYEFLTTNVDVAKVVKKEIEEVLTKWKDSGRWDPIVAEMAGDCQTVDSK